VRLPGRLQEEPINRYIVSKGDQRTLVLYWYQSAHRIIADEYMAKIFTVLDGVRYRRSDTSLVRVIVPVTEGDGETAQRMAIRFLEETYPGLVAYLPH
jgi:EpsI family protein